MTLSAFFDSLLGSEARTFQLTIFSAQIANIDVVFADHQLLIKLDVTISIFVVSSRKLIEDGEREAHIFGTLSSLKSD